MTAKPASWFPKDMLQRRLRNQLLSSPGPLSAQDVLSWLGAAQAQDYAGAKWALGLRSTTITDADVERAVNDGAILRTHILRPTWHFVSPADIRWMLALTAPRVKVRTAFGNRWYGLDTRTLARTNAVIERALRDGGRLTRTELASALRRARIPAEGPRLAHVVIQAELDGVICSGPRAGRQFTYALLDDRVPRGTMLRGDEALAELTGRYFRSRGPATAADFAWWSGLTMREVKKGIEMLGADLEREQIGECTWWTAGKKSGSGRPPHRAYLLPNYDEYLIAYRNRDAAGAGAGAQRSGALFANTIVIDGRIAGTWRRRLQADTIAIEVLPTRRWSAVERRLVERAVHRYSSFIDQPVRLKG